MDGLDDDVLDDDRGDELVDDDELAEVFLSEPPHATSRVSSATTVRARVARESDRCMRPFRLGGSASEL